MSIPSYPDIFHLGQNPIQDIFSSEVEITEKVDGSMFCFGSIKGIFHARSKRVQLTNSEHNGMFKQPYEYTESVIDSLLAWQLDENIIFYSEYLSKPKHNTIVYNNTPKNGLMLFGVHLIDTDIWINNHKKLEYYAKLIDIDVAPLLFYGKIEAEKCWELLSTDSYLGGSKIEGIVVKNYNNQIMLHNRFIPVMIGKYVSESFKERNHKKWKDDSKKSKYENFCNSFLTEARWRKAVYHLKEDGNLELSPRDIGNLIKEVQSDIIKEHEQEIKDTLYNLFHKDILRTSIRGLPEWYKEKLAKGELE